MKIDLVKLLTISRLKNVQIIEHSLNLVYQINLLSEYSYVIESRLSNKNAFKISWSLMFLRLRICFLYD